MNRSRSTLVSVVEVYVLPANCEGLALFLIVLRVTYNVESSSIPVSVYATYVQGGLTPACGSAHARNG